MSFIRVTGSVGIKQSFQDKSHLKLVCFFSLLLVCLGKDITSTSKSCISSMLRQLLKRKYFTSFKCF